MNFFTTPALVSQTVASLDDRRTNDYNRTVNGRRMSMREIRHGPHRFRVQAANDGGHKLKSLFCHTRFFFLVNKRSYIDAKSRRGLLLYPLSFP
jgi:hypothetical protein